MAIIENNLCKPYFRVGNDCVDNECFVQINGTRKSPSYISCD